LGHILVCAVPNPGHVSPMLALAQHLSKVGHQVTFHTSECFRERAESAGLRFVPFAGKANYDYRCPPGLEKLNNATADEQLLHHLKKIFAETIPDQHQGIQRILRETPVDLILVDTIFFGLFPLLLGPGDDRPPVLGCGVNPMWLSSVDCGPLIPSDGTPEGNRSAVEDIKGFQKRFQPLHEEINRQLSAYGVPQMPHYFFDCMYLLPDIFLQFTAEAFEFPRRDMPDSLSFAGPLLPAASTEFKEPAWWGELDDARQVVLVTQGTLANQDFGELIQPALVGLANEDVLVIVAAGRSDTEAIVAPANARVASFIPFDRLLPKVDVMVTNGGYGAVNHACSLGVPIVTAGDTEDKAWVGARVGWSGAGINLKIRYPKAEQIRDAVRAVLREERYREAARLLRLDFASYDALGKITEVVESTLAQERTLATTLAS
jgi:MGT family glycosyltransferase